MMDGLEIAGAGGMEKSKRAALLTGVSLVGVKGCVELDGITGGEDPNANGEVAGEGDLRSCAEVFVLAPRSYAVPCQSHACHGHTQPSSCQGHFRVSMKSSVASIPKMRSIAHKNPKIALEI